MRTFVIMMQLFLLMAQLREGRNPVGAVQVNDVAVAEGSIVEITTSSMQMEIKVITEALI